MKGGSFGDKKFLGKKVTQCRKESKGGTLSVPSGFVGYLEKLKEKGGNLWTKFALAPDLALGAGGFRIVSKKWTDQCEDCSLKKKRSLL